MAGFDFQFKSLAGNFFDAKKIAAAADKAHAKVQAKFGAYTRRRMKSSLKYRDGKSPAGQPPSAHRSKRFTKQKTNKKTGATTRQSQSPLRELIFFARDPATNSVVVGPVVFGSKHAGLLERGGPGTFKDPKTGARKSGVWAPRPFARPAGEAEIKTLPALLRGSMT